MSSRRLLEDYPALGVTQMRFDPKGELETQQDRSDRIDAGHYPEDYCLKQLETDMYLWDMRCWKRYKSKKETRKWIADIRDGNNPKQGWGLGKNYGHSVFCIRLLLRQHKTPIKKIMEAIMRNPHIQYQEGNG